MSAILGVGVATLDIISTVEEYPGEDEEIRAIARRTRRGGNAANTLDILAQIGHACRWAGVLSDDADGRRITAEFDRSGIDWSGARIVTSGAAPVSCITVSRTTGSRTIIHYRGIPEFSYEDFTRISTAGLDWIHFEGRQTEETHAMIAAVRRRRARGTISLEVEKPRPGIETLCAMVDVLFYSRAYALHRGYDDGETFLRECAPDGVLAFCAWGSTGAWARSGDGEEWFQEAFIPEAVIDTVGAGDVFNAGVIDALVNEFPVNLALERATRLAGMKCAREGLEGVV